MLSFLVLYAFCCVHLLSAATEEISQSTDSNFEVVMRPLTQAILRRSNSPHVTDVPNDNDDSLLLFMFDDKTFLFKLGMSESVENLQQYLEEVYGVPVEEQQVLLKPSATRKLAALDCIPTGQPSDQPSR